MTRIDPIASWQAMSPEEQERIGATAIALALGIIGSGEGLQPFQAYTAAEGEGSNLLIEAVRNVDALFPADKPAIPDLSKLGVRTCRECGCTDNCGCDVGGHGCHWIEDDLCSACRGSEFR